MPVNVIDTLKPKNGLSFPVVEAIDVFVENYGNLADAISHFATDAMIAAINAVLSGKANTSDVNTAVANLQGQINQIVISASAEAVVAPEVAQARIDEAGTEFNTLKARLDSDSAKTDNLKIDLSKIKSYFVSNSFDKDSSSNVRSAYLDIHGNVITIQDNRFCYSHLIDVIPGKKYTFLRFDNYFGNTSHYAVGYKDGVFAVEIEGVKSTVSGKTLSTITIPSGVNQIRINYLYGSAEMVVEGEASAYPADFIPYGKSYQTDELVVVKSLQGDANTEEIKEINSKIEVYDKTIASWSDISSYTNQYIKEDGTRASSQYLKTSEYISVKVGDTVVARNMKLNIGGEIIYGVACYDADKNFMPGEGFKGNTNYTSGSFVVPENCKYVAISELTADESSFDIKSYTTDIGTVTTEIAEELKNVSEKKLVGRKIVNFGDSIFGQARPPKDVSTFLADFTGATVYNCGFGGCRMGLHTSENYDPFSMYRLAYAIAENDWTLQDAALEDTSLPSYFDDTIALMKSIDWSEIDICTIAYGTNDFADGLRPYRTDYGKTDMRTYSDALRYSIETLLNAYPNLRIFVITPHYRFWLSSGEFADDSNTHEVTSWVDNQNYKLTDYVQAGKDVAKEYQLPVIDDYYDLGFNKFNRSIYYPSNDGTHQNITGRKMIAEHIAAKLY